VRRICGSVAPVLAALALVMGSTADARPRRGTPAMDLPLDERGQVSGVGIEGQDISRMADQMVREMLANPAISARATPPRIIIDSANFRNQSSQRIDRDMITDELRSRLMNASAGRLLFVGREFVAAVEEERQLKREGVTDGGTTGLTRATAGADYRLVGKITSLDSRNNDTGMQERMTVISFELLDLEYGTLIWNGTYRIRRAGSDDVVYR